MKKLLLLLCLLITGYTHAQGTISFTTEGKIYIPPEVLGQPPLGTTTSTTGLNTVTFAENPSLYTVVGDRSGVLPHFDIQIEGCGTVEQAAIDLGGGNAAYTFTAVPCDGRRFLGWDYDPIECIETPNYDSREITIAQIGGTHRLIEAVFTESNVATIPYTGSARIRGRKGTVQLYNVPVYLNYNVFPASYTSIVRINGRYAYQYNTQATFYGIEDNCGFLEQYRSGSSINFETLPTISLGQPVNGSTITSGSIILTDSAAVSQLSTGDVVLWFADDYEGFARDYEVRATVQIAGNIAVLRINNYNSEIHDSISHNLRSSHIIGTTIPPAPTITTSVTTSIATSTEANISTDVNHDGDQLDIIQRTVTTTTTLIDGVAQANPEVGYGAWTVIENLSAILWRDLPNQGSWPIVEYQGRSVHVFDAISAETGAVSTSFDQHYLDLYVNAFASQGSIPRDRGNVTVTYYKLDRNKVLFKVCGNSFYGGYQCRYLSTQLSASPLASQPPRVQNTQVVGSYTIESGITSRTFEGSSYFRAGTYNLAVIASPHSSYTSGMVHNVAYFDTSPDGYDVNMRIINDYGFVSLAEATTFLNSRDLFVPTPLTGTGNIPPYTQTALNSFTVGGGCNGSFTIEFSNLQTAQAAQYNGDFSIDYYWSGAIRTLRFRPVFTNPRNGVNVTFFYDYCQQASRRFDVGDSFTIRKVF